MGTNIHASSQRDDLQLMFFEYLDKDVTESRAA